MQRVNIFNYIHKALRAMLYETSLHLQHTDFADMDEAEISMEKVRQVVDFFDGHAAHEDHFVLPAIGRYEPSLVDAFEQEHVEDHALSQKLRDLLTVYNHAVRTEVKVETGQLITQAFMDFMIFNLKHMAKEETVLNRILWRYYTDEEIKGISQRIMSVVPPDEAAVAASWMLRGLSNAEITGWLNVMEKTAPQPVFSQLLVLAEKELPGDRFRKVMENLTEGALVA